jgi:uncharacterized protein (DUF433 family)
MSAALSLTPKEVAALAGTTEKAVRNEIASGAVTPLAIPRGRAVRRSFDDRAVVYFTLLRRLSLPVPAEDWRDLYRVLTEDLPACGRWTRTARGGLRHADLVTVDTAPVRAEVAHRLDLYRRGLARIESRRDVLGGEPVFKGTRLSVRHIGGMVANGVPMEEIREDYPDLSEDDVAFATLYARMKPAPGRPAKPLRPVARAPVGT